MDVNVITEPAELELYNQWVRSHPKGSLWQSIDWKRYQEALGKEVRIYANDEMTCTGLVIIDRTSGSLSTWEVPYGPLWKGSDDLGLEFMKALQKRAAAEKALALYFNSPVAAIGLGKPSNRLVYPEATRALDLTLSEEDLLKQMKPKGRYNIKVAQKNDVTIEESTDVAAFAALHAKTAARDQFTVGKGNKYAVFLESVPGSFLLLAKHKDASEPIAGLLGFVWQQHSVYYYGASDHAYRAFMAPYALQWGAILHCKAQGATGYNLFGVTPADAGDSHPWKGITSFKEKFGGDYYSYLPEQVIVLRPIIKALLDFKRKFA